MLTPEANLESEDGKTDSAPWWEKLWKFWNMACKVGWGSCFNTIYMYLRQQFKLELLFLRLNYTDREKGLIE